MKIRQERTYMKKVSRGNRLYVMYPVRNKMLKKFASRYFRSYTRENEMNGNGKVNVIIEGCLYAPTSHKVEYL